HDKKSRRNSDTATAVLSGMRRNSVWHSTVSGRMQSRIGGTFNNAVATSGLGNVHTGVRLTQQRLLISIPRSKDHQPYTRRALMLNPSMLASHLDFIRCCDAGSRLFRDTR